MRYIVAHLIDGEAKTFHECITADLAEKFDVFPLHERIPPHLTLKRWFNSEEVDIADVYTALDTFVQSHSVSPYTLSGFGSFRDDVIYIDVQASDEMYKTAQDLIQTLKSVPNMTFDEYDNGRDFHATVVLGALKPFAFAPVWKHLQGIESPQFDMTFNNIATLKKIDDVWEVDRRWALK